MKRFCLVVLLLVVTLTLSACNNEKDEKVSVVGKWTYEQGTYSYIFNEDGSCEYNDMVCSYTTEGEKLKVLFTEDGSKFETVYKVEDNKLILKDSLGKDTVYLKQ